jgi:hypothetical protein
LTDGEAETGKAANGMAAVVPATTMAPVRMAVLMNFNFILCTFRLLTGRVAN